MALAMKKKDLETQSMVALDAIEESGGQNPNIPALLAPILAAVAAHGKREGKKDYEGRSRDVAFGSESVSWKWPLRGADDAYVEAVGVAKITRSIGIPERLWEYVSDAWLEAFRRSYTAAHEAEVALSRRSAQLDCEIAEALAQRPLGPRTRRR